MPTGPLRRLAETRYAPAARIGAAAQRLNQLAARLDIARLRQLAGPPATQAQAAAPAVPLRLPQLAKVPAKKFAEPERQQAGEDEYQQRAQSYSQISNNAFAQAADNNEAPPDPLSEGMLRPVWLGGDLLLGRTIDVAGQRHVQGCWLDWAALRQQLIESVHDILPQADIAPDDDAPEPPGTPAGTNPGIALGPTATTDKSQIPNPKSPILPSPATPAFRMATLPVRLVPGPLPGDDTSAASPLRLALVVAWAAVLLAGLVVAGLLHAALSLSERRAAFVAAVTHELRTPLTTLRMYSEMLLEGMVTGEDLRRRYTITLHAEADRLSHLVENVLAYARLERGSARARRGSTTVSALLERLRPRLGQRAAAASLELLVDIPAEVAAQTLTTDASAVEQVLFNLVDNASKHASGAAADKRLHLEGARAGPWVELRVRDHGPGIAPAERGRLFRPFTQGGEMPPALGGRGAAGALAGAPGIGLGLALSRRLARSLHGDLRFEAGAAGGACFVLMLPVGQEKG